MVIDKRTQEIYNDILEISDILLKNLFDSGYEATNDTAHGRIINQLLWFKQQINNNELKLPLSRDDKASLSYIYTHGNIEDIKDSKLLLNYLLKLSKNQLILKTEHYPQIIEYIDQLTSILSNPGRNLDEQENKLLEELIDIKPKLQTIALIPHINFERDDYPALWFSYAWWDDTSSLDNIPNAGKLIRLIQEGLVEGVRIEAS